MNKKTISICALYIALILLFSIIVITVSFRSYFYKNREYKTSEITFVSDTKVVTNDSYSIDVKISKNSDKNYSEYKVDYVKEDDLLIAYVFIYGTYIDQEIADEDNTFNLKVPLGDADKITFYGNGSKKTLWIKDKDK